MGERAGPLMTRHMINGCEVLLPADAVLRERMRPDWPLCPICMGDGGGDVPLWICGECGGGGQVPPKQDQR
jgi:hypothetical protein